MESKKRIQIRLYNALTFTTKTRCPIQDTTPDMYMIITNKTKDRIILYTPTCYGIPEGDECMTWLSHWRFGSHEVGPGDEINVSIFVYNYITSIEVKEVGVHLVYEEQEQAGVHSAKRRKIQQACDDTFQYVIPVNLQPDIHHGTTQLYLLGCSPIRPDCLVENIVGKYVLEKTGEALSLQS